MTIHSQHPVLLIRVAREFRRGISGAELYEAARSWWKVSLARAKKARWAFAVFGGVVRAVYVIESWESPTDDIVAENPKRAGRWAFVGQRDAEMEERYQPRDVTAYLPMAEQNPVRHVNPGAADVTPVPRCPRHPAVLRDKRHRCDAPAGVLVQLLLELRALGRSPRRAVYDDVNRYWRE